MSWMKQTYDRQSRVRQQWGVQSSFTRSCIFLYSSHHKSYMEYGASILFTIARNKDKWNNVHGIETIQAIIFKPKIQVIESDFNDFFFLNESSLCQTVNHILSRSMRLGRKTSLGVKMNHQYGISAKISTHWLLVLVHLFINSILTIYWRLINVLG